uniref:Uncharacterized protein n=1 Tax=Glossina pallidipes TaxID=7398 RepID=A0A1B0AIN5_GLOPL
MQGSVLISYIPKNWPKYEASWLASRHALRSNAYFPFIKQILHVSTGITSLQEEQKSITISKTNTKAPTAYQRSRNLETWLNQTQLHKQRAHRNRYLQMTIFEGLNVTTRTIVKEKFDPLVGAWFRTATGEKAAMKDNIVRKISISDISMKHEVLVADVMDESSGECTKDNIIVEKAVVSPVNNLIPVPVFNPTKVTREVQKKDIIAQCQKAEYVVNNQAETPKPYSKISAEAEILIKRWTTNVNEQQKNMPKSFSWKIGPPLSKLQVRVAVLKLRSM